ncbi:MAG TPA: ATP-binding protein [Phototrophicaceae bacterium]|nr:ATP-binding protein [Phototrophicaceae bacterium]
MTIPSNQDFATEVRVDRLRMLARVTLIAAILVAWILLNFAMLQRATIPAMTISPVIFILGALATRRLLNRTAYNVAAWTYVTSGLIALAVALAVSDSSTIAVLPFAFPILIFIVGLLLRPANTIMVSFVTAAIILVAPLLAGQPFLSLPVTQISAIALSLISAIVAAQVAGDLYQIADWALANYQRERRVAGELFESEQTLERTLARSNALGDRLQETNVELEQAREAAEEAKHFRGQFLANMSHELRTPLNAIIGFSETMLKFPAMYDGVRLPNAYEADLQQIYTSGRQLLTLINDILDLAKVDAGKLEVRMARVDLQPMCKMVVSTASGLVGGKPIELETDIPDYLPPVWADETRVRQVLLNLYSNAAKFTESGSIKLAVREIDDGVQVSVSDTGIGISKSNAGIIFEEFKQAETGGRDPRSGAGLGLAISRQLLTLMGGRIWVESELGHGSTFHFTLPAYHDQQPTLVTPEPEMVKAG